jgi:uncharacterized protein Yka (UPF0111/DUF47 family)
MNKTDGIAQTNKQLSKQERKKLIGRIRKASGVAQYALEEKLTDEQVILASENLKILSLIRDASNYNRYCQQQKTAEANAKLKEFMDLKNSEIYQAGKWLLNALTLKGSERQRSLLKKDLVHKEDYNQGIAGLKDTVEEQQKGIEQQTLKASQTIKTLESKIDSLRRQLIFVQDYITNNYGKKDWNKIVSYIQKDPR